VNDDYYFGRLVSLALVEMSGPLVLKVVVELAEIERNIAFIGIDVIAFLDQLFDFINVVDRRGLLFWVHLDI